MHVYDKVFDKLFLMSFFISIVSPIFPQLTGGMIYHVLLISFLPLVVLPFCFKMNRLFFVGSFCVFYIYLFITVSTILFNAEFETSDVLSSVKITYFFLYVWFGYIFLSHSNENIDKFVKVYFYVLLFSIFVSMCELVFPSINHFLYKREGMDILQDKVTSIFNTTYHYAFFLFFGFIFSFVNVCFLLKEKARFKNLITSFLMVLVIFSLIMMTKSRMFVLSSAIFVVLYFLLSFIRGKFTIRGLFFTVCIIGIGTVSVFYSYDYLSLKFEYVFNGLFYLFSGGIDFSGEGSGSFNTRINQILFSWDSISRNPLLGAGVGKELYLESVYSYMIYKYGILGCVVYLALTIYVAYVFSSMKNKSTTRNEYVFYTSCTWFLILSPFYFLSGPLFEVPKLSYFFFALLGFAFGAKYNNSRNEINITKGCL